MVWTPVFSSSPAKPLWIQSGGVWKPAWSEDPCICCGFQSCEQCKEHLESTGLGLAVGGFPVDSCDDGDDCIVTVDGGPNGGYALDPVGVPNYELEVGTYQECTDRGLKIGRGINAGGVLVDMYVWRFRATGTCSTDTIGFQAFADIHSFAVGSGLDCIADECTYDATADETALYLGGWSANFNGFCNEGASGGPSTDGDLFSFVGIYWPCDPQPSSQLSATFSLL